MVAGADAKIMLRFSFKVKGKHSGWVEVYGEGKFEDAGERK